jgi:alpha,alpha-trehalose phosphorylase
VRSTRLVSFTHRAIAACSYEVEAVDEPVRLIVQSELVANEQLPTTRPDPRVEAALEAPLVSEEHLVTSSGGLLVHRTRASDLRIAAAMDHIIEGPDRIDVRTEAYPDWARTTIACVLRPGERLRIVKMMAYGWSSRPLVAGAA